MRVFAGSRGITLIETLVAVSVVGIMVVLATTGLGYIQAQRVTVASRDFLGDLQRLRQKAMTQSLPLNGSIQLNRGFGIRILSPTSYVTFEFIDTGATLFKYDNSNEEYEETGKVDGGGNRIPPDTIRSMQGDVTATLGDTGNPTGDMILFDKNGLPRGANWSIAPVKVYVLRSPSASTQPRCVQVDQVRVREGTWTGASCVVL